MGALSWSNRCTKKGALVEKSYAHALGNTESMRDDELRLYMQLAEKAQEVGLSKADAKALECLHERIVKRNKAWKKSL